MSSTSGKYSVISAKSQDLIYLNLLLVINMVYAPRAFTSLILLIVFSIKFLLNYIKKHDFKVFGYYRIALGILVLLYFLIK